MLCNGKQHTWWEVMLLQPSIEWTLQLNESLLIQRDTSAICCSSVKLPGCKKRWIILTGWIGTTELCNEELLFNLFCANSPLLNSSWNFSNIKNNHMKIYYFSFPFYGYACSCDQNLSRLTVWRMIFLSWTLCRERRMIAPGLLLRYYPFIRLVKLKKSS